MFTCPCPGVIAIVTFKNSSNILLTVSRVHEQKRKGKKLTMADLYATPLRSLSPGLHLVSGCSSTDEGCTDTNAYWKILNPFTLENRVAPG